MKKNTKRVGIIGTAVVALAGTGVAFAAFTSTGAFQASGAVHDAPIQLTAGGGSIDTLYPGGCSDVTVTFVNPNDHDAKIDLSRINTSTLAFTANDGGKAVINPNIVSILSGLQGAAGSFVVPANGNTASFTVPNMVCLSKTAVNTDAAAPIALSGTVPFVLATDSEYNG